MSSTSIKERLKDESYWLRLPFMVLFFLAWKLTELVLIGVILVQVVYRLVMGEPQQQLQQFGSQLTVYAYQLFRYLTFNTDTKPFPFSEWPETEQPDSNPYMPHNPPDDSDSTAGH
ncbi:DUF4389 domain-containing protein [Marinospirillum alkaliphilum]|uniref:Lipase n=1 Tax=Marinospirillum alkaliphilum DSM 21637 TaxID=1122209 RepID=A0A1K1U1V2_9GAMM|nr:DUF4389 domain-containing protein [Marinospirillum alkaliphilum]SFX06612.1 protein of unknown function [Marinospirillum alkaliphilum DSM 21637]